MVDYARSETDRGQSGGIAMGLDDFLTHDAGGGGGGFLANWRKEGELSTDKLWRTVRVWLHLKRWATLFINHGWPRVVERKDKDSGEKSLKVWGGRWGCYEREVIHAKQNFRNKQTGAREYPCEVCPICKLVDLCVENLRRGTWKITQPIFHFEASDPAESLTLTAGGICNRFNAKDLSEAEKRLIKAARYDVSESYRENLKSKGAYLFCVCDDEHPDQGLQKTFEGEALATALKKAVKDEMVKAEAMRPPSRGAGDPTKNPYPFVFSYNDKEDFSRRYNVVALNGSRPTEQVLDVINATDEQVAELIGRDCDRGNCFALRASMEAHLVQGVTIDWERLFGAAEKAGLMVAPPESKDDEPGGDGTDFEPAAFAGTGDAFERGGAPKAFEQGGAAEIVKVPVDHPVWSVKPAMLVKALGSLVEGKEALLDVPESADDALVQAVTKACTAAGAVGVGELVPCDHCGEGMSTLDSACPTCGARVNEEGKLASRPCLSPGCKGQVPFDAVAPGQHTICPVCATVHELDAGVTWAVVKPIEPEPAPAAAAPRRGRRAASAGAPPFAT